MKVQEFYMIVPSVTDIDGIVCWSELDLPFNDGHQGANTHLLKAYFKFCYYETTYALLTTSPHNLCNVFVGLGMYTKHSKVVPKDRCARTYVNITLLYIYTHISLVLCMKKLFICWREKQQNDENLTVTFDVKDLESPSDDTTRAKFETDSPSHSVMSETEQAGVNSTSSDSESDSYRVKKSNADPTGHDNGGFDSGFEISTRSKHRPSLTNQKACIDAGL